MATYIRHGIVKGSIDFLAAAIIKIGSTTLSRGSVLRIGASGILEQLVAKTAGKILVGDGTDVASVAVSGDATLASTGALTIASAPTIVSKVVGFAEVAALGAVANGQVDFAAAIPAGAIPVGAWIAKGTDFSGGTLAAVTASLGLASGDVDRYTTPEDVFTGAGAGNLFAGGVAFIGVESMHPEGAITPSVNFVCTTDTCDGATAGSLTAYLAYTVPKT